MDDLYSRFAEAKLAGIKDNGGYRFRSNEGAAKVAVEVVKKWFFDRGRLHKTVNLARPVVDGKLRYQAQCSCGRLTKVTSRRDAEGEQKTHRREMMHKG